MKTVLMLAILAAFCTAAVKAAPQSGNFFAIKVVDDATGRGVPLVELKTTNHLRYVTDSAGYVAFYEPGMMDTDVHFMVKSHGYEFAKDGFGYAGITLKTMQGGSAELRVKRTDIAERIYRITGQGIYSDSILLGHKAPLRNPVIEGLVTGQDSVLSEVYKDKVYWFWGDTSRVAYPLGNFHSSGATSPLPGKGGLDPDKGVDLTYFVDNKGFSRGVARLPEIAKSGPVWLGGLVTLDGSLYAMYSNVDNAMHSKAIGIAKWDDEKEQFDSIRQFDLTIPIRPTGHPFRVHENGVEYIYYSPITRVRADLAHLLDSSTYEAYTCAKPGSRLDKLEIDRGGDGKPRFAWKPDTTPLWPAEEAKQIQAGVLKPEEALFHIRDCDTGKPVTYHGASISWNPYRQRWTMVLSELFGTSCLGEVWYLEADTPLGPWAYARKIVTHNDYTFYNPRHHPFFDKENGRIIYFEGTYTTSFSGAKDPTPRYDYNQIMYKLDLESPRLALPVPIYSVSTDGIGDRFTTGPRAAKTARDLPIAFFAPDLPSLDTREVYEISGKLVMQQDNRGHLDRRPAFYALPADTPNPPATATPLYEFVRATDGRRAYTTDPGWSNDGFTRSEKPICLVWKNPMTQPLPLNRYRAGRD